MKFTKNAKKTLGIISLVLVVGALFYLIASDALKKERYIINEIDIFDTVTQIVGYESSQDALQKKADDLLEELRKYHKLYDIYHEYTGINNLRTINENAGIAPVKVDKEIIDLLEFSIDLHEKSNGEINIAMGSVLKIWHQYRNAGIADPNAAKLPSMEMLEEANAHTDINKVIIDKENSTVYLEDPEMSLDVGSIGKGYAVQKVAEYARTKGYNNIAISVGGNIAAVGSAQDGSDWRFAVQNPFLDSKDPYVCKVDFSDLCLVTSGDYQRYYIVDDKEYCHIIDPDTLMPAEHFKSVSIIIPDSGLADALSTALFNMPYEDGVELLKKFDNAEAIWVFEDGTVKYTDGFEKYIVSE